MQGGYCRALLTWHPEALNIWSHLAPALAILLGWDNGSVYLRAASIPFALSAFYHVVPGSRRALLADQIGVVLLAALTATEMSAPFTSRLPPLARLAHHSVLIGLTALSIEGFARGSRASKTALGCVICWWIPPALWVLPNFTAQWVFVEWLWWGLTFGVYLADVPDRLWTNVPSFSRSHLLFHICVVTGVVAHDWAAEKYARGTGSA